MTVEGNGEEGDGSGLSEASDAGDAVKSVLGLWVALVGGACLVALGM